MQIKIIKLIVLISISYLYSFEVNTHQAITRCALTTECGMEKISNLENFVKNTELNTTEPIPSFPRSAWECI